MTLDANFFVSLFNIDMLDVYRKGGGLNDQLPRKVATSNKKELSAKKSKAPYARGSKED